MTDEAGTFLSEETVNDGMLHETADQRLVYTSSTAQFGEGDPIIIRNVRGELVMVDKTETEGIRELGVYLINPRGGAQRKE